MKIVCYGDSNTYGWDPRYFSGNHYDHPWPELMGKITGHRVINCGEPGRVVPHTGQALEWFRRDVTANAPDLLVIMLGTNDLFYTMDKTAEAVADRMSAMVRYAVKNSLAGDYLLLSCPQVTLAEEDYMQVLEEMSERYRKIARQQEISFADPFRWDIPMAFDGVHFTQEGHRIFADKISGIIMENREQ